MFILSGCGGGGGGGDGDNGRLTLGITDAPADDVVAANVVLTAVTLEPEDGPAITFRCDQPVDGSVFDCGGNGHREIDLLALAGDASETLLDGATVPAGRYERIRFGINAGTPASPTPPDAMLPGSTLELAGGGTPDLLLPDGQADGLEVTRGFRVSDEGATGLTVDFDLRRAILLDAGDYVLRPVFRLVETASTGTLDGSVDPNFVVESGTPDVTVMDCATPVVHVYQNIDGFVAGDLGATGANEPEVTVPLVAPMATSDYTYEVGFLEEDSYRVAIACGENDDPDVDDADVPISDPDPSPVAIIAGTTTTVDFAP